MKKILMGLCLCFALVGCQAKPNYTRNTEMGVVVTMTFDEAMEKMENKETFMFAFTQTTCGGCLWFKENILSGYIKNHGFDFNEVSIDTEKNPQKIIDFVAENPNPEKFLPEGYEPTDVLTPTFYFVEDGEIKDIFVGTDITEKDFDQLIQKYKLDEVKE